MRWVLASIGLLAACRIPDGNFIGAPTTRRTAMRWTMLLHHTLGKAWIVDQTAASTSSAKRSMAR